jgi:hypothetical protein
MQDPKDATKFCIVERYEKESSQEYHLSNPVRVFSALHVCIAPVVHSLCEARDGAGGTAWLVQQATPLGLRKPSEAQPRRSQGGGVSINSPRLCGLAGRHEPVCMCFAQG